MELSDLFTALQRVEGYVNDTSHQVVHLREEVARLQADVAWLKKGWWAIIIAFVVSVGVALIARI